MPIPVPFGDDVQSLWGHIDHSKIGPYYAQKVNVKRSINSKNPAMKAKELREKSPEDLNNELLALRREQFNLRMQKATGQLSQTHQFGNIRRDIARIKTVLRQAAK